MSTTSQTNRGEGCHISPTARVASGAVLGARVRVGDFAIIHNGVTVGDDSFIAAHSILGEPTRDFYKDPDNYRPQPTVIGPGAIIRANACIYSGVRIGERFECGPGISIREQTVIGARCSLGNYCDLQGYLSIGDGCRIHSSCHLAQHSKVGSFVWMFPFVLFVNDPAPPMPRGVELHGPTVGDYCILMSRTLLLPGVTLGRHVVVASNSKVNADVEDWTMVGGDPARRLCDSRKYFHMDGKTIRRPYPWPQHWEKDYQWAEGFAAGWTQGRGPIAP